MKLFRTHQHIFRLLFIYPIESSATIQDKFLIILFGILVFFNQIFCWIGSTLFLEQYIESTKYVIMVSVQIAALSASIYILVIAVLQRQKITSLIDEIQGIFDSCEQKFFDNFMLFIYSSVSTINFSGNFHLPDFPYFSSNFK